MEKADLLIRPLVLRPKVAPPILIAAGRRIFCDALPEFSKAKVCRSREQRNITMPQCKPPAGYQRDNSRRVRYDRTRAPDVEEQGLELPQRHRIHELLWI